MYTLLGLEIYKNYNVYYSILLTQLVEVLTKKKLYIHYYALSLAAIVCGALATIIMCIYYGAILVYSKDRLTYYFAITLFALLSLGLFISGMFALYQVPDDLVNFVVPIPVVVEGGASNIAFQFDSESQSYYFRYSPIVGSFINSAITLAISIILVFNVPNCKTICDVGT
jgi:hypothetical protein